MASSPHSGVWKPVPRTQTPGLTPEDRCLAVRKAGGTIYVTPEFLEGGWRGWWRGPPGELDELVVSDDRLEELATDEAAEVVAAIDTPAWPAAFGTDP